MPKASSNTGVRRGNRPSDQKTGEKGTPMTPIPSASLIVLAPRSSSSSSRVEYETVMLQRTARDGSSFKSAVVFPGGALDLADETPFLSSEGGKLTPEEIVNAPPLTMERDGESYMKALKLCALRETFEELGLLLVPSSEKGQGGEKGQGPPRCRAVGHKAAGMSSEEWAQIREEVHNDASLFPPFLRRIAAAVGDPYTSSPPSLEDSSILPPLAPMHHHSNWITPRSVVRPAKRFDAHFFITVLDEADLFQKPSSAKENKKGKDGVIEISADGTETTSLRVATPYALVQDALADQFVLFPPQFYILGDLAAAMDSGRGIGGIVPLNFFPEASSIDKSVTPVEEEARGLQGRNYTWDKKTPPSQTSKEAQPQSPMFVSYTEPPFTQSADGTIRANLRAMATAIEPRPMPSAGATVSIPTRNASGEWERDATDEPFTFPLCLPGDSDQSRAQADLAGLDFSATEEGGKAGGKKAVALNRVFVSPRTKKDGGGLVVRGIQRQGVASLRDFKYGTAVERLPPDEGQDSKSRL